MSSRFPGNNTLNYLCRVALCFSIFLGLVHDQGIAQTTQTQGVKPIPGQDPGQNDANGLRKAIAIQELAAQEKLRKQHAASILLIIFTGVLALVLVLFLLTYWLSRRTHQMLREPLPAANRGDELWFLKEKKQMRPVVKDGSQTPPGEPNT